MTGIPPELEAQLSGMSDGEFAALTAKVRAPDNTEAVRAAAAKIVPADVLDVFMSAVNPAAFVTDGRLDEAALTRNLTALFGTTGSGGQQRSWGQNSGGPAAGNHPGDGGRHSAAQRFGTTPPDTPDPNRRTTGRGANGAAEAQRRQTCNRKGTD